MDRQAQLQPGDEFRPYDLFTDFAIIPASLMRCKLLTPSERLCLVALGKRLGPTGTAFPSYERLALDLGLDRRQVIRIVASLRKKQFVRIINRPGAKPIESTSNEFRLLWHPALAEQGGDTASLPSDNLTLSPSDEISPPPSDNSTPPGSDKVSPEKKKSSEKQQLSEKEQSPKRGRAKATSSDDAALTVSIYRESRAQTHYVSEVESFVCFRECIRLSADHRSAGESSLPLGGGDRSFAVALFSKGISIESVKHGINVACFRWYVRALQGNPLATIKSLRYFAAEIEAAEKPEVTANYRKYVASKLEDTERQWLALGKAAGSATAGLFQGAA